MPSATKWEPISFDALAIKVFDQIEAFHDHDQLAMGHDHSAGMIKTGISDLDRTLGGGAKRGRLLLIESPNGRLADAVGLAITWRSLEPTFLAVRDADEAMRQIIASASGVSETNLRSGTLSDSDLNRLVFGMAAISGTQNLVLEAYSPRDVMNKLEEGKRLIVAIGGLKLGKGRTWIVRLMQLAWDSGCAVVATSTSTPELPGYLTRSMDILRLVPPPLGSAATATLISAPTGGNSDRGFSFTFDSASMRTEFQGDR